MKEIMDMLNSLHMMVAIIKDEIRELRKPKLDQFKDTWIDGQDVMQTLHISKRTLQNLRDQKTLPYSRINGKFYYKLSDIERLLDQNYSNPKAGNDGTE